MYVGAKCETVLGSVHECSVRQLHFYITDSNWHKQYFSLDTTTVASAKQQPLSQQVHPLPVCGCVPFQMCGQLCAYSTERSVL